MLRLRSGHWKGMTSTWIIQKAHKINRSGKKCHEKPEFESPHPLFTKYMEEKGREVSYDKCRQWVINTQSVPSVLSKATEMDIKVWHTQGWDWVCVSMGSCAF
eukprot:TRINITY_DN663_c0_g1_i1.p1 TRINITY_DN663_c0_g1~~TRINITY_DN663_c0_g1_i1.p1  ORF type:complete len:103 (+),score=12.14 TRINITY_DN663_c0_g1_i1:74-382(+)